MSHTRDIQEGVVQLGLQDPYAMLPNLGEHQNPNEETTEDAHQEGGSDEENSFQDAVTKEPDEDEEGTDPASAALKQTERERNRKPNEGVDIIDDAMKDLNKLSNPKLEKEKKEHEQEMKELVRMPKPPEDVVHADNKASGVAGPPDDDIDESPDVLKDFDQAKSADTAATKAYLESLQTAQDYVDKHTGVMDWIEETCMKKYCVERLDVNTSEAHLAATMPRDANGRPMAGGVDLGESSDLSSSWSSQYSRSGETSSWGSQSEKMADSLAAKLSIIHQRASQGILNIERERDAKIHDIMRHYNSDHDVTAR